MSPGSGGSGERSLQCGTIILASGSQVRRRLLRAAGLRPVVRRADVDERALIDTFRTAKKQVNPEEIALSLSEAKARSSFASRRRSKTAVVVGADQLLLHRGSILQKVECIDDAYERLWSLRAGTHTLITGCVALQDGEIIWRWAETVQISMRSYSQDALSLYLAAAGEKILDSVACYEIEGLGGQLIESIEGDYFSALGLPLLPLISALRACGAVRE